jgi:hypothetical protein
MGPRELTCSPTAPNEGRRYTTRRWPLQLRSQRPRAKTAPPLRERLSEGAEAAPYEKPGGPDARRMAHQRAYKAAAMEHNSKRAS